METQEHYEKARIVKINLWITPVLKTPSEGDITLRIFNRAKNLEETIECFVYGEDVKRLSENKFREGDVIYAALSLISFEFSRWKAKQKSMIRQGSYTYQLRGKIIGMNPSVIDCGIYVKSDIQNNNLGKGDYIKTEGRLDAHIIGKVN